jgi:hypothetical protein
MFRLLLLGVTLLLLYDAWHHFKEEKGEWAIVFLLAAIFTFILFLVSF